MTDAPAKTPGWMTVRYGADTAALYLVPDGETKITERMRVLRLPRDGKLRETDPNVRLLEAVASAWMTERAAQRALTKADAP